jgi:N utilization substance protein B
MPMHQEKFREIVFQLIYSSDFIELEDEEIVLFMMKQLSVTKRVVCTALERSREVRGKCVEIDQLIENASVAYDFSRITRAEKNILRLALFELFHDEAIPPKVAIAEAIRLARKFGTPEGASFVNAILDGIYKQHCNVSGISSFLKIGHAHGHVHEREEA